jgi:5'-hydroxyaverantin dehydrogenase
MQVDTTSWEAQLAAFKATLAWSSSRLDIVIPSAGVSGVLGKEYFTNLSPTDDPPKPSTLALAVNLTGVYYTALLAIHYFQARPADDSFKPQLCFVSSLAGYGDLPFSADYSATKWGVRHLEEFARSARREFAWRHTSKFDRSDFPSHRHDRELRGALGAGGC